MSGFKKSWSCMVAGAGVALAASAGAASAAGENVSGSMGVSYNSHFVSYGADVWGGGTSFFGSRSTAFAWADVAFDLDPVVINGGVWFDINDNAPSSIGGDFQEIDWYVGATYTTGIWSFGATYQEWNYAADVERILDLSLSWDDSGYMGDFTLSPSIVWHIRVDGNGAQEEGSAIVASIAPGTDLGWGSLSFPLGVGLFLDGDFQGGTSSGLAYGFLGGSLSVPLGQAGPYGEWALSTDLIYYSTDGDSLPGNVKGGFLTASVGLSVAF